MKLVKMGDTRRNKDSTFIFKKQKGEKNKGEVVPLRAGGVLVDAHWFHI